MSNVCRVAFAVLSLVGCLDTAQRDARVELLVIGTDVSEPFAGRDGASVLLSRAQLAFGPLTLCAGREAGALCDDALLEWRGSVVVDADVPTPKRAGTLVGTTGTTRSWMYDLGIVSLLTNARPVRLDAAQELSGHSLWIEGTVEFEGRTAPFRVRLALAQNEESSRGVPIVRKSPSEEFEHRIAANGDQLRVRFDPRVWLREVDFADLLTDGSCTDAPGAIVCSGDVEQLCGDDGSIARSQDCSSGNQVCVARLGCVARLEFSGEDQGSLAVRNQVLAGSRPVFDWDR